MHQESGGVRSPSWLCKTALRGHQLSGSGLPLVRREDGGRWVRFGLTHPSCVGLWHARVRGRENGEGTPRVPYL